MHFQCAFCRGAKKKRTQKLDFLLKVVSYQYSQYSCVSGFIWMEVINQEIPIKMSQSWQPLPSFQLHSCVFWGRIRILLFPEVVLGCPVDPVGHGSCASRSDPTWEHQLFWMSPSPLLLPGISWDTQGDFWHSHLPHTLKNPIWTSYSTLMSNNCWVFSEFPPRTPIAFPYSQVIQTPA